jgi:hypothetical protein
MEVLSNAYQSHRIFIEIDKYIEFYDFFSESVTSMWTSGTRSLMNIDEYIFSSMSGTLESIADILKKGRLNDAFALLRKFHDSAIMSIYTCLYLEENIDLDNFIVHEIQDWLEGKKQLPSFREMNNYIKESKRIKVIYDSLKKDDRYKKIRSRCTDNMHYNFYWNVILNDNKTYNQHRGKYLDQLLLDIKQLVLLHLSYIFYCKDRYLSSSDYVDYLDSNLTPPENSQYWVAPYIQEVFDNLIREQRPDIAQLILSHTCMNLQ